MHNAPRLRVHVYVLNLFDCNYLVVVQAVTYVEIIKYGFGTDIAQIYKKHSHFNNEPERPTRFLPRSIVKWLIGRLKYIKHY